MPAALASAGGDGSNGGRVGGLLLVGSLSFMAGDGLIVLLRCVVARMQSMSLEISMSYL
jgi:hypothetical protein